MIELRPTVIVAFFNAQCIAISYRSNWVDKGRDSRVFYFSRLAKYAVAFFNMSRSCVALYSSAFKWVISCSGVSLSNSSRATLFFSL